MYFWRCFRPAEWVDEQCFQTEPQTLVMDQIVWMVENTIIGSYTVRHYDIMLVVTKESWTNVRMWLVMTIDWDVYEMYDVWWCDSEFGVQTVQYYRTVLHC